MHLLALPRVGSRPLSLRLRSITPSIRTLHSIPTVHSIRTPLFPPTLHLLRSYSTNTTTTNQHPLTLCPPPPIRDIESPDPAKGTLTKAVLYAWYYCRFLFYGVKLSWEERKLVNDVRRRVNRGGLPYDWREIRMEDRVRSDLRKMIPFVVIAAVIEEIVPLLILLAPTLIPSTVLLPTQSLSVRQKEEDRRHDARSALLTRIEDKANPLDLGWKGDDWVRWADEDIKKLLRTYDLGTTSPSRSYLESRVRNHLRFLEYDDKLLIGRAPSTGLTPAEFQKALGDRGLLCLSLPSSGLPSVLNAYLDERRRNPTFHPFVYLVEDVLVHQRAHDQQREDKREEKRRARVKEMSENGGYYGWRANVRRWALDTLSRK